jgi:predicted nucleic acid-binding protein
MTTPTRRVLDANILLRYLLDDVPELTDRCEALLLRVQRGEEMVWLPDIALADVIWTLRSFYKRSKAEIRDILLPILSLRGIHLRDRAVIFHALTLFAEKNIDFSDSLIAAEMLTRGYAEIYSYDRDFDKVLEVERVEP